MCAYLLAYNARVCIYTSPKNGRAPSMRHCPVRHLRQVAESGRGLGESDYPTHVLWYSFPTWFHNGMRENIGGHLPLHSSPRSLGSPPPPHPRRPAPIRQDQHPHHIANSSTTALASRVERGTPSLYFGHRPHVIDGRMHLFLGVASARARLSSSASVRGDLEMRGRSGRGGG